jgi:lysophospholipase L1-like esterase
VWAFRFACVVVALLPFVIAELYLRTVGRVDSSNLSDDPIFETRGRSPLFVKSATTRRWEISESRLDFFRPATFAVEKPANLRRIFVLGGSTVQGRPYETETAFAKWLELRLTAASPGQAFEVVNCGGVSYASYRIALILEEVLQHEPDLIVLYTGHNEFLEERSYDTLRAESAWNRGMARRLHLVRMISDRLSGRPRGRQTLTPDLQTRLDLVDGMKRYVRDPAWRSGVVEHFGITLERMINACHAAGVPLLLCVPASDMVRTPPFKTLPAPGLDAESRTRFQKHWDEARDPRASDDQRVKACEACLAIDPQHAGAHFVAATLHWHRRLATKARLHFVAARDHDVCPLRATTPIIDRILEIADRHGIAPVRCDRLFDQSDSLLRPIPDGISDPQRFVDHVHPTIAGHQQIAKVLSQRVLETLPLPISPSAEEAYQAMALDHLSSLDETYFARGKQRLEGLRNWAAGRAGTLRVEVSEGP